MPTTTTRKSYMLTPRTKRKRLLEALDLLDACRTSLRWVKNNIREHETFAHAWKRCRNPDWLKHYLDEVRVQQSTKTGSPVILSEPPHQGPLDAVWNDIETEKEIEKAVDGIWSLTKKNNINRKRLNALEADLIRLMFPEPPTLRIDFHAEGFVDL